MTNARPRLDTARSAIRAHADSVAALCSAARATPVSGASLAVFDADRAVLGLIGAQPKR